MVVVFFSVCINFYADVFGKREDLLADNVTVCKNIVILSLAGVGTVDDTVIQGGTPPVFVSP